MPHRSVSACGMGMDSVQLPKVMLLVTANSVRNTQAANSGPLRRHQAAVSAGRRAVRHMLYKSADATSASTPSPR